MVERGEDRLLRNGQERKAGGFWQRKVTSANTFGCFGSALAKPSRSSKKGPTCHTLAGQNDSAATTPRTPFCAMKTTLGTL